QDRRSSLLVRERRDGLDPGYSSRGYSSCRHRGRCGMSTWNPDMHAQDSIGRRRGGRSEPVGDYERSGRFAAHPDAAPDPNRVAALCESLGLRKEGDTRPDLRDARPANPVVDQWEAAVRLAETYSRGHQRLQNHANLNTTLGEFFR